MMNTCRTFTSAFCYALLMFLTITAAAENAVKDEVKEAVKETSTCAQDASCIFENSVEAGLVSAWQAQARLLIVKGKRERLREGVAYNLRKPDSRDSMRLFRFDKPTDVAGIAFLIHENSGGEDDIWMYLPSMRKTRRILSSGKNDSFIGSDFSYADLMAPRTADYRHQLLENADCLDAALAQCHLVDSVVISPRTAQSLGYSRIKTWIKADSYLPYRVEYFDAKDKLFKVQELSGFIAAGTTWVASQRIMTNTKTKSRSQLQLNDVVTDIQYDPNLFTEQRLGRNR